MSKKSSAELNELQSAINHEKSQIKIGVIVLIVFLIFVAILGRLVVDAYLDVQVAKNGELAKATIIQCDFQSGDDDSEDYYKIFYEYVVDGEKYSGNFKESYPIERGEEIWIRHNGKGRSVPATHPTSFFAVGGVMLIFLIVFTFADGAMIVGFIGSLRKIKIFKRLGVGDCDYATATFISEVKENVDYGKIKYMWEDKDNNMHEGKSLIAYSANKIAALKKQGTFKIKYIKSHSIVVQDDVLEGKVNEVVTQKGLIRCPYCSTLFAESQNKCPNCGAPRE